MHMDQLQWMLAMFTMHSLPSIGFNCSATFVSAIGAVAVAVAATPSNATCSTCNPRITFTCNASMGLATRKSEI